MVGQTPDFSGWASVNDQKCSDGRTIKSGAFAHMDKKKVPLVWQHQHGDPMAVLGHAILENRAFGVFCHGYFNDTENGQQAKLMVQHKDVESLSIFANNLDERRVTGGKEVYHGDIKEVSLVLAGANPGAVIENVNIVHGDSFETIMDEAYIFTGLGLVEGENIQHSEEISEPVVEVEKTEKTNQEIFDSFTDEQREVIGHMLDEALSMSHADEPSNKEDNIMADENDNKLEHADEDKTVKEVFDSMSEEQQNVVYYMIGEALDSDDGDGELKQSGLSEDDKESFLAHFDNEIQKGFSDMHKNIFEQNGLNGGTATAVEAPTLSHSQLQAIVKDTEKTGSFKESFIAHAATYGFEDIDILFPDAQAISSTPEFIKRRTEWVSEVLGGTKHSPISRIKTIFADITGDEARARGYVKGNLKKDEVVKLLKRVTTPTTVYKKQKLDRDDMIDITSLDVVAWLKAEMRLMLDEEVARAILIGDGREVDDEDKIDEDHLRPIAYDHELFTHTVQLDSNTSPNDIVEGVLYARREYKGTGNPVLFTTDEILTDLILQKDAIGRRLYETEQSLAAALRVSKIVTVEVMAGTDIVGIIVNLQDYTVGADAGGRIGMFDDFDIDYNQYKYLIETRISGTLTKPKSALVIKRTAGTPAVATQPNYDASTHTITIPTVTGVEYFIDNVKQTAGNKVITKSTEVVARPASGYSFAHGTDNDWYYAF